MRLPVGIAKWIALAAWTTAVVAGFAALDRFSVTPGAAATGRADWPADWPFRPAGRGVTLVVSLHPRCGCSVATLGELAQLMTYSARGVEADVLMVRPEGLPEGWERGSLWETAAAIPNVHVIVDPEGKFSAELGALTSGQSYAFDSTGRMLFSGGITPARGHMGDSAGSDAIHSLLLGQSPARQTSPVFGCPLNAPANPAATQGNSQ
jgi:hypothetical protein